MHQMTQTLDEDASMKPSIIPFLENELFLLRWHARLLLWTKNLFKIPSSFLSSDAYFSTLYQTKMFAIPLRTAIKDLIS